MNTDYRPSAVLIRHTAGTLANYPNHRRSLTSPALEQITDWEKSGAVSGVSCDPVGTCYVKNEQIAISRLEFIRLSSFFF